MFGTKWQKDVQRWILGAVLIALVLGGLVGWLFF